MQIREFIEKTGHTEDYEGVSLHPYAYKGTVKEMTRKVKLNIFRARKAVTEEGAGPETPIWITEVGWPVDVGDSHHPAVSDVVQKERLESVFNMIKKNADKWKIENLLWYNIEDAGTPDAWEHHCGLFTASGNERPSMAGFKAQAE
jgi:exo-beta-1,3-glucanase (GH17 family)